MVPYLPTTPTTKGPFSKSVDVSIMPAGTRSSAFPSRNAPTATQPAHGQRSIGSYGKVPLSFEANQGQADPRVKFLSRGSGYTLFLTGDEAVLALRSQKPGVRSQRLEGRPWSLVPGHLQKTGAQGTKDKGPGTKDKGPGTNDVLRMKLVGANEAAKVTALEELPGKSNYFIGNDPKKWRVHF